MFRTMFRANIKTAFIAVFVTPVKTLSRALGCSCLLLTLLPAQAWSDVTIATTIRPLQFIARAIVGDSGSVSSVIDQQDSPHHYIVSPSDRINLQNADLLLWIGPEFEVFLGDFFQRRSGSAVIIAAQSLPGLTLHQLSNGHLDPHLWLDSNNALLLASSLTSELSDIDPDSADIYAANLGAFTTRLQSLNRQIEAQFVRADPADYLVYHDAYQYFEKQFGLNHGMALLQDPELEPGMRDILAKRRELQALTPACIFLEADSNPALIDTMLADQQPRQITVDLLGYDITAAADAYVTLMQTVAGQFADCLYGDTVN
jgi:zinc transport system substrate-binding protein